MTALPVLRYFVELLQLRLAAADSAAYCCALADLQSAVGLGTLVLMTSSKLIFKVIMGLLFSTTWHVALLYLSRTRSVRHTPCWFQQALGWMQSRSFYPARCFYNGATYASRSTSCGAVNSV